LVVVALLALACKGEQERIQREEALKAALAQMRAALAAYKADHGRYPTALSELAPRYLRAIPTDPVTNAGDWRVTTEETVQPSSDFQTTTSAAPPPVIVDVRSNAPGPDRNGVPYANY
jgi:type II secretory pathway pseudopilin PulG